MIATMSALGLPGLNSFAGEFLAFLGTFQSSVLFGVLGTLVVIPAAWYMLRFFQGAMEGIAPASAAQDGANATASAKKLVDLRVGEWLPLLPLVALIFFLGFVPNVLTRPMQQPVGEILSQYNTSAGGTLGRGIHTYDAIEAGTHRVYTVEVARPLVSSVREDAGVGA
jgi:NADH:ubiquinone oxidoreductase subunit 4 (subunit M)